MKLFKTLDDYYIDRCLKLARNGEMTVSPNPMVGCVVVDKDGRRVGEGFHQRAGYEHAELIALNEAGEAAKGGTLYVNLEPCNHHGRTPPCTDAIIKAGITKVVCGTLDPNPKVSGAGRDALQNHRISVRYGFLEEECLRLNEKFFHYISTNHPFVTLKMAMTTDGKIATRNGESKWITGELSRQYVHHMRSQHDAIMTTADTVIADNPQLTVRHFNLPDASENDGPSSKRSQPIRIILDRQFKLNPDAINPETNAVFHLFDPERDAITWVFTSKIHHNEHNAERAKALGIRVFEVDDTGLGLSMKEVYDVLGQNDVSSVMVEAGGRLAGHLMRHGLVNKLQLFMAPMIMPDPMAIHAFSDSVNLQLPDAPRMYVHQTRRLERDIVITAYPDTKSTAIVKPL